MPGTTSNSGLAEPARTGFAPAAAYDAHRPTYPTEAVETLLARLGVTGIQHAKIADLAAGTGKLTELLAARPENYDIIAVEPHDGMREQLRQKNLGGVKVIKGTAESMPEVADGSLAAVVVAQAFHWFANINALQEIYRVLQPTGRLGMIWNIEDYNAPQSWKTHTAWEKTMKDVIWSFDDDHPRFRHEKWRQVFEEQKTSDAQARHSLNSRLFSIPLGEDSVAFETWLSRDDIWARYRTLSQIAILEGDELDKVKKTLFDALDAEDTRTDDDGRIAVDGRTFFAWTSRVPEDR